jgi:hypothetical protein
LRRETPSLTCWIILDGSPDDIKPTLATTTSFP